jgi:hypothetical protein
MGTGAASSRRQAPRAIALMTKAKANTFFMLVTYLIVANSASLTRRDRRKHAAPTAKCRFARGRCWTDTVFVIPPLVPVSKNNLKEAGGLNGYRFAESIFGADN